LNTDVAELRWVEADAEWEATLHHLVPGTGEMSARDRSQRVASSGSGSVYLKEEKIRAKIVVSCVGVLVEPNPWPPSIPGRDTFEGEVFHTSRWRDDVDLNDKNVIVIGAGSSAAQVVPSLLKEPYHVKSLTQIIRAAPWIMPRLEEPFGKEKFAKYAPTVLRYMPILGWIYRVMIHAIVELVWFMLLQEKHVKWRKLIAKSTLDRTYQLIPEKYHQMMTPDYTYGCKRRVFDCDWLASMNKPNFNLTDRKLLAVGKRHLTLGAPYSARGKDSTETAEEQIPADVIVLANGFESTHFLQPMSVLGRKGVSLHEVWVQRGGPQAYLGAAVDGFPNFFMSFGPNTANGTASLLLTIENVTGYIANMIQPVLEGKAAAVEIKREALDNWTDEIQRGLKKTVFLGCTSWYVDERGYNPLLYS
jgi:cation diffusion facilitator CzcD-associated flavoprotein CzcO